MAEIIMLGTGHATVTNCYNTCFLLRTPKVSMLVDGGGGNGILTQLKNIGARCQVIDAIFLTHTHTDHILGIVWVLRMIGESTLSHKNRSRYRVFSHREGLTALTMISRSTLSENEWAKICRRVEFVEIKDQDIIQLSDDFEFRCFDLCASDVTQYGFIAALEGRVTIACVGDIPCTPKIQSNIKSVDWLMHEAFCLERERKEFQLEKIRHCTVKEAACIAQSIQAHNLVLYHTADNSLADKKSEYKKEALKYYYGNVYVPTDLEVIEIASMPNIYI